MNSATQNMPMLRCCQTWIMLPALFAFLTPVFAHATAQEQVPVGVRAIGMGGAYSAIADDATALFWNPAGLAQLVQQETFFSRSNLFGLDIVDNYFGFAMPITQRHFVGIDWYHSGFDDSELGFKEDRLSAAYSFAVTSSISFGLTAKYMSQTVDLDAQKIYDGWGLGVDTGLLFRLNPSLRLSLAAQDLLDTKLHNASSGSETTYPRSLRFGASYAAGILLTSVDVGEQYHLGAELQPLPSLAIRGGLLHRPDDDLGVSYSFGAGLHVRNLRVDYAYRLHPVLEPTHYFGVALGFNFNPPKIRIERVETSPIYSSLYKSYAQRTLGTVWIRNMESAPLTMDLSLIIPELMSRPTVRRTVVLKPDVVTPVPFAVALSERALSTREDRQLSLTLEATYQSGRLMRSETTSHPCIAYGRGAIHWSQGIQQVGAFITARDAAVDDLARTSVRIAVSEDSPGYISPEIATAAAITNSLAELGMTFIQDPYNAYARVSQSSEAVDTIQYPRETLRTLGGDCDDTSILMASLLANVDIDSKLIDVPGHLFLLVDSGFQSSDATALSLDPRFYAVQGDRVWIPIETTAISQGFAASWRLGAERLNNWAGEARFVDVREAMDAYEPSNPFATDDNIVTLPELASIRSRLRSDAEQIDVWRSEHFRKRFGDAIAQSAASASTLNEMARIHFLEGELDQARIELQRALVKETSARLYNNLALSDFMRGDLDSALSHFQTAVELDSLDGGIWLNVGVVGFTIGDSVLTHAALSRGVSLAGGFEEACRRLSIPTDPVQQRGSPMISVVRVKLLLRRAMESASTTAVSSSQSNDDNKALLQGPSQDKSSATSRADTLRDRPYPSIDTIMAMPRSAPGKDVLMVFYWKKS